MFKTWPGLVVPPDKSQCGGGKEGWEGERDRCDEYRWIYSFELFE